MNNGRRILVCLLLIALLLVMTGCGAQDEWEAAKKTAGLLGNAVEDPQLRADTERLLDAMIRDDYAAAWDAVCKEVDASAFRGMYVEIQPVLAGIDQYELVASSINKTVTNGVSTVTVRYMMTAGELRLVVEVARTEGYEGLTAFYFGEYKPVTTTGTLGNMQGADALQWIFLIVGLLEWVFVVVVFVDCCRHKMRKKWLWLLIVVLGHLICSVLATPEQFHVTTNIGLHLTCTCLIYYSTGGCTVQILVPLGAIIYLCLRKTLFAKYAAFQQQKEMTEQTDQPAILPDETPQADTAEAENLGLPEADE